jgi:membrane-associated phospholipid phosphatase
MRLGAAGRIALFLLLWAPALGIAFWLDRRIADWVRHTPLYHRTDWFVPILKLPGHFLFTLAVCALLALFHRNRWRAALPLLISGPIVGLVYLFLKWAVGRRRPVIVDAPFNFHPFAHGLMGFIHAESGLSFPSGHATLAFATATCLAAAIPRWSAAFFVIACAVGAERVLENAHYVSDVVAGMGLGVFSGWLAIVLVRRLLPTDASSRSGGV